MSASLAAEESRLERARVGVEAATAGLKQEDGALATSAPARARLQAQVRAIVTAIRTAMRATVTLDSRVIKRNMAYG